MPQSLMANPLTVTGGVASGHIDNHSQQIKQANKEAKLSPSSSSSVSTAQIVSTTQETTASIGGTMSDTNKTNTIPINSTRVKRNSLVEMLSKVPVIGTRGSLLTALDKLLKTIDVSESAIMIPTLLRDKCEFDAQELLIIAKIIKASILGHSDLVEFYMNHIHHGHHTVCDTDLSNAAPRDQHTPTAKAPSSSASSLGLPPPPPPPLALNGNGHSISGSSGPSDTPTSFASCPSSSSSSSASSTSSSTASSSSLTTNPTSWFSTNGHNNQPAMPPTRTAQPPTLLQLATTNQQHHTDSLNHRSHQQQSQPLDQRLSNILESPDAYKAANLNGHHVGTNGVVITPTSLTITSTGSGLSMSGAPSPASQTAGTPTTVTSYPRAETIDTGATLGLPGDPCVSAKLLQQIEQLKISIANVTSLLESVVELYKSSVDNIAS